MKEDQGFVYLWINDINSNWYIGSHKGTTDDGYIGSGIHFKKAIEKYGIENFTRCIIYEGSEYREQEQIYLDLLDAANCCISYNLTNVVGLGPIMQGRNHTEESKEKMRIANTGRKHTEETKKKISDSALKGKDHPWYGKGGTEEERKINSERQKGKKLSPSHRENVIKALIGRVHSDETKKKISEAKKGKSFSEEHKNNLSKSHKDKKASEETRRKMSESKKGRKHSPESIEKMRISKQNISEETRRKIGKNAKRKIICPHCDKEGNISNMKRWHFDNCKHKLKEAV